MRTDTPHFGVRTTTITSPDATSSYRQASRKYGVPIATLSEKIKLKVPLKAQQGKNRVNYPVPVHLALKNFLF